MKVSEIKGNALYELLDEQNPARMRLNVNMAETATKYEELFEIRYNENLNRIYRYLLYSNN